MLAKTRIADAELAQLQRNLILSHCVGVGEPLATPSCGSSLVLKVASLARGYSGVRARRSSRRCSPLATPGSSPAFRAKGSVGASGDLAPLRI